MNQLLLPALAITVAVVTACSDVGATNESAFARAPEAKATMPFSIERLTETFSGTAREVMQVSGYTYVAVELDGGAETRWAVVLAKEIDEGARVRVRAFGKKEAFESKKLGRTFDELWFALITQEQQEQQEGDRS